MTGPAANSAPAAVRPSPWSCLLIVVAGLAAYANSLPTPFLFDDFFAIRDNPTIRQLWPLSIPLSPPADGSSVDGRPVVNLTFALNHAAGGLEPFGYHLANLAIHLVAALALFGVVRRALQRREAHRGYEDRLALLVALLWLLHPLQTESVTFVVQRTESLVGMFFLLTFLAFVRAVEEPGSRLWPVAAVGACLLGMATKEVMVTAPLLLFLFDRTFYAGSFAAAWKQRRGLHLSLAATTLVVLALMLHSGASRGNGTGGAEGVNAWSYLLTQSKALVLYAQLALWPHPLVVDYGTGVVHGLGEVIVPGLAVVAALVATVWALVRRPAVGFLGAWFFLILAPSSSVVPLATQTMAEHRVYLPLAAFVVGLVLAIDRLGTRLMPGVGAVLVLVYGGLTAWRNHDYRTPVALWSQTVRHQPGNERAHNNLGQALVEAGRPADAVPELEAALAIRPTVEVHGLLCLALASLGRLDEALAHGREAVRLSPANAAVRASLGRVLADLGRWDEARAELQESVRLAPAQAAPRIDLGLVFARSGRLAEAAASLQAALALEPTNPVAQGNLGSVFFQQGNLAEAVRRYEEAVRLNPDYAEAWFNLGMARVEQGRPSEAVRPLQRALALQPNLRPARELLDSLQPPSAPKQ